MSASSVIVRPSTWSRWTSISAAYSSSCRHRRQEHRRALAAGPGPHEAADRLGEEQRRRGRGRVDADREPRDVDTLRHHPDRDHPARFALGELRDLARPGLLVRQHHHRRLAGDVAQQLGVDPRGLLVGRDHQAAGVGHVPAYLGQPSVGGREHLRDPRAGGVERGAQRLRGEVLGQRLAEPGGDLVAGAGPPLQVAGVGEEQHRPDDVVGERLLVAVGVVGHRARYAVGAGRVGDERDRVDVGAERRTGQRQPAGRRVERLADALAPGQRVAAWCTSSRITSVLNRSVRTRIASGLTATPA